MNNITVIIIHCDTCSSLGKAMNNITVIISLLTVYTAACGCDVRMAERLPWF